MEGSLRRRENPCGTCQGQSLTTVEPLLDTIVNQGSEINFREGWGGGGGGGKCMGGGIALT